MSNLDRRASLFFGTESPAGGVSPVDWQGFVSGEIAPRFPAGYTVSQATGGYRYADGRTVQEPTHVLSVVFPHEECPDVTAKLAEIARAYRQRFRQVSVLETIDHTRAILLT